MSKDGGTFEASDSGFMKELEIFFGTTISPFIGGPKGSKFLVTRGAPDDLGDQPGVLPYGHMFNETVVADKVRTGVHIVF